MININVCTACTACTRRCPVDLKSGGVPAIYELPIYETGRRPALSRSAVSSLEFAMTLIGIFNSNQSTRAAYLCTSGFRRIWSWARPKLPNLTKVVWLRLSICSLQSNITNVSHPSSALSLASNKPRGVSCFLNVTTTSKPTPGGLHDPSSSFRPLQQILPLAR